MYSCVYECVCVCACVCVWDGWENCSLTDCKNVTWMRGRGWGLGEGCVYMYTVCVQQV